MAVRILEGADHQIEPVGRTRNRSANRKNGTTPSHCQDGIAARGAAGERGQGDGVVRLRHAVDPANLILTVRLADRK